MIDETFHRIEERIRAARGLGEENRQELIALVGALKSEVGEIADRERAADISHLTEQSAHAATHETPDPQGISAATKSLEAAVQEFEAQHPRLVERVNRLCVVLSNMGI